MAARLVYETHSLRERNSASPPKSGDLKNSLPAERLFDLVKAYFELSFLFLPSFTSTEVATIE